MLVPQRRSGARSARASSPTRRRWRRSSRDNPTDTEARIFYALAVDQTAPPTDKTYAKHLKAAGILEPLFKQMPSIPGLAHYIIHAYDAPPLADKALAAARALRVARAGGAARAAHAVAHLHARRLVEGIDRDQPAIGRSGAQEQRRRRGAARARLPDLRLPADRAGQGRPRPCVDHALRDRRRRDGAAAGAPVPARSRWRRFRRATRSSAARGPRRRR